MQNTEENIRKLEEYIKYRDDIKVDVLDVMKTVASLNGVKFKKTEGMKQIDKIIPSKKHMVFILLDGFGYYKLKRLGEDSILKQNNKMKIKTVNPTSTACVLTSLMSASYPNQHGIYGWWDYNKDYDLSYYPLLLEERKTGEKLKDKGISNKEIYKFESIFNQFKTKVNVYERRDLINSEYTNMFSKKASKYGFYSIKDCFEKVKKNILERETATFNYIYINGLDEASHSNGVDSKEVSDIINAVENGIKNVANEETSVILIADHGQVDMTSMMYLNQKTDYTKYFYALPSIDTRMISFFVKNECTKEFEEKFMEEFSQDVILLTKEQAKKINLFGSSSYSEHADKSLGEYIAVVVNNKFLVCDKLMLEDYILTKGNHSGLTKEEITVPFVVI
ncbi:type I phosphodiesterase/nucleotide pyrophosphatase [Clostridium sp. CAG:1219]|nr:type I phosphodiesterase/nucleotide pyrophosphatase [Clostridium sp. CAG:1219]